jgi:UDP-sugar transporter A1/2/3
MNWISVAGVPAALYAIQNLAALKAYQNLDALTFNVLNQTKTLSAALCCYIVMGKPQSLIQVGALFLLLVSALVMEGIVPLPGMGGEAAEPDNPKSTSVEQQWDTRHLVNGVFPIILASFISGLAGAISQKYLQKAGGGRNAYLFSMELCVASVLILTSSLMVSPDGKQLLENGFWEGWTPMTFIPIISNSVGGIIVGLVTKYAGSVRKGFALIFGILLSGVAQAIWQPETTIKPEQIAGGILAGISLYLHGTNPPKPSSTKTVKQD